MDKVLEKMKGDLQGFKFAAGTRNSYLRHAELFMEQHRRPPVELGAPQIEGYVDLLAAQGRKIGFRRAAVTALRFLYCVTLERPEAVAGVLTPQEESTVPEPLSSETLDRLMGVVHSPTYRTILHVALGGGMRVHEVCRLRTDDIDSLRRVVRLRWEGGGRPQVVPLDRFTLAALREWWRAARPRTPLLFTAGEGEPVVPGRVDDALRAAWRGLMFEGPATEPVLRYSFFLRRLREGAAPREVMHLLRTTAIRHVPARYLPREGSVHVPASVAGEGVRP